MAYFITIVLFILGIIFKKSKIVFYSLLIWMWILFGWNSNNADYNNYIFAYENAEYLLGINFYEVGYRWLVYISKIFGLSYQQFLILVSGIGLSLMSSSIKKYSKNPTFVLALYLFSTFFTNVVQVRSFIATAIIIYAIRYLVEGSKRGIIIYGLLTIIATTIHFSAFFYILFVFCKMINKKVLLIGALSITILSYFISTSGFVQHILLSVVDVEKVVNWISGRNLNSYIFNSLIQIISLIIITIFSKINKKEKVHSHDSYNINGNALINLDNYMNTVYEINLIMLISTVLYLYDGTFIRIFTGIIPLNLIFFSNILPKASSNKVLSVKALKRSFVHIIYAFVIFATTVLRYADYSLLPIMKYNVLFDKLR